jgi:hypothetical protein
MTKTTVPDRIEGVYGDLNICSIPTTQDDLGKQEGARFSIFRASIYT